MIVAIIQARVGSTRLPGKVLKEIDGTPILEYMIRRVIKSKLIDNVVVATTNLPEDDAIVSLCQALNVEYYRGHSEDVLGRYYLCAKLNKADVIIRLTADCPFIDPEVIDRMIKLFIDRMIKLFKEEIVDYLANTVPTETSAWPNGSDIEVFSMDALKKAHDITVGIDSLKAEQDREHISPIFIGGRFTTMQYGLIKNLSKYRYTVDYLEDLETADYIAKEIRKRGIFGNTKEIIKILDERLAGKYETLTDCPWCNDNSINHPLWCIDPAPFKTVKCPNCGMVYVRTRLNQEGRDKFYKDYYSKVHQVDETANKQRDEMYALEYEFIKKHIDGGRVLDVGCSGGHFLKHFSADSWTTAGVDYGDDWPLGRFDLIIFRGVIEHTPDPKLELTSAIRKLNPNGKIFIGSTPNRNSLCAELFREQWSHHDPKSHIFHFAPDDFIKFFYERGLKLIGEKSFYLETPYAKLKEDLSAIDLKIKGDVGKLSSPPFYGNLMTLMFEKE